MCVCVYIRMREEEKELHYFMSSTGPFSAPLYKHMHMHICMVLSKDTVYTPSLALQSLISLFIITIIKVIMQALLTDLCGLS